MKLLIVFVPLFILIAFLCFYFLLPHDLFDYPQSTVIYDRKGKLLGARIADDGQWRFPKSDSLPEKFKKAIILYEDKNFYYHPGFDLLALSRAFKQNIKAGKVVSGGSTLTMQVIRLSGKGRERTYLEKLREIIMAARLEMSYSKKEILKLYASNAPFGGNVVGLEAAAWRYYGRSPHELSWAEVAALAVLPNAPSMIYPGKNRTELLRKRNFLLKKLFESGEMDSLTFQVACLEPLPGRPQPLPQETQHLLTRVYKNRKGKKVITTIDAELQQRIADIVEDHHKILQANEIHNAAVIVAEVETGDVLAYVGNTENNTKEDHGNAVDIITSPRSTGSILKPLLFAAMLDEGEILQNTLVPDLPTFFAGYSPKNFNNRYEGVVPAKQALSRSLNVPAVRMLHQYGVEKFHYLLRKSGITTLDFEPSHYGLSLILGGAEAELWDLAGVYTSLSRILRHFYRFNGRYCSSDIRPLNYYQDETYFKIPEYSDLKEESIFSAGAIWLTYESLLEVNRPQEELGWKYFSSSQRIAWKTGTSFGFRDAWSIGTTSDYVVAVWAGNADGEGRPGLTGVTSAAPIMFDVFGLFPSGVWFEQPFDEMVRVPVCRESGYRASSVCTAIDTIWIVKSGLKTIACPYHKIVHLDSTGKYRVNSNCEDVSKMQHKPWFVLPPVQEWFYKLNNPLYKPLPPMRNDCFNDEEIVKLEFIYPKNNSKVFIPYELDGTPGRMVSEVAHREQGSGIYWHLDDEYHGYTEDFHQMELRPGKGYHIITVVDENGEEAKVRFNVISEKQ